MTTELTSESTATANSSTSVITSSSYCGSKSGIATSTNASINIHNHTIAHNGDTSSNANSLQTSQCSGSSMQERHPVNQVAIQNSNSAQISLGWGTSLDTSAIWSSINDGPQCKSLIPGAKSASSDMHQSASINNHTSMNGQLVDQEVQSGLRNSDCRDRFSNEPISGNSNQMAGAAASLSRPFIGCNGNGNYGTSQLGQQQPITMMGGNDSFHNPYGAQFGSSSHRPNSQVSENNSSSNNTPYSGWQGPNLSANSSYKNWSNIPEGRNSYVSHNPNATDRCGSGQRTSGEGGNSAGISNHESSNDIYDGLVGATGVSLSTNEELSRNGNTSNQREGANSGWGIPPPRMGLLGGGESSLNNGNGGWGGPPTSGTAGTGWSSTSRHAGNTGDQGETSSGLSSQKPHNTWAQAAGKGLNPPSNQNVDPNSDNSADLSNNSASQKMRPEEQDIKYIAAYSDGWGQDGVNQDTSWDVPLSPQSTVKEGTALWRPQANNGTEIWENNVRNRKNVPSASQANPQQSQQSWTHTPTTHIGGHWGEEEESSGNMWTGVPPANSNNWNEDNNRSMWPDNAGGGGRDREREGGERREQQQQQQQGGGGGGNHDNGTAVWGGGGGNGNKSQQNIGTWSSGGQVPIKKESMPQQPSGWEEPSPPPNRRQPNPSGNFDDGTAVWGNPGRQGKVSNWKDMAAAASAAAAAAAAAANKPVMNNVPPNMAPTGPGMIRLPQNGGNKQEMLWGKAPTRSAPNWADGTAHRDSPGVGTWEESSMKNNPVFGAWNDQTSPLNTYWGAKPKNMSQNSWSEGQIDTSSWGGPSKLGGKPLSKDLIWASKQFRVLTEMGYKKDDVENALRNANMVYDDAIGELNASNMIIDVEGMNMGRTKAPRPDSVSDEMCMPPDPSMDFNASNFHGAGYPVQGSQVINQQQYGGFKPPVKGSSITSNTPASLLNNAASLGVSASSLNSITALNPNLVQKLLLQQQSHFSPQNNHGPIGGRLPQQANTPSTQQLRHMLQQIQMAVQAGHLNPHILNYPLAPQTLQLLFQLLQQIKQLHQLQQQQYMAKPPNPQLNVQITQTKQRIGNLQNQIAAQQAMFLKQGGMHPPSAGMDPFKDPSMTSLHSEFRDMSLKDPAQSRLTQWKLPAAFDNKEESQQQSANTSAPPTTTSSSDFSRAPGSVSKASSTPSTTASSLHPLLADGGTWAPRDQPGGWPDSTTIGNADSKAASPTTTVAPTSAASSYFTTDMVPEFEPGKPWKGTSQMKNIEDDPHITPGSVAKSPLSVNTIKTDSELFSWTSSKSSPMTSSSENLVPSSNPWAYNASTSSANNGSVGKQPQHKSNTWGSLETAAGPTDLWGAGPISKSRGPPPGLSAQGKGAWSENRWSAGDRSGWDRQPNSNFLVLRNLTPQIDGSTLKTLCMQHGPLQLFHLFLNHGIALARYTTREEAAKAQSALNNCVLGNTTILADIPSDSEVQRYLQLAGGQPSAASGNWSTSRPPAPNNPSYQYGGGAGNKVDNWGNGGSHMWSFTGSSSGNLWSGGSTGEHDQGNPNSYLPGDLLGGESM